ncbi:calcium channel protein CCH1 ASCRUDRAFT_22416, partial [Ascoidea rubescens DSM 1968]
GNSLKIFTPNSKVRIWCSKIIIKNKKKMDYFIVFLLVLTFSAIIYQQWNPESLGYVYLEHFTYIDFILMGIYAIFVIEIAMKIIVLGLYDDFETYNKLKAAKLDHDNIKNGLFLNMAEPRNINHRSLKINTFVFSLTNNSLKQYNFQRAFLHDSANCLDLFSVISFWISILLSINNFDIKNNFLIFRALGIIRIFELIRSTKGNIIILRSFKHALPQLIDVFKFIIYFWVFFAIIGVQTFKSSLRRTCVWENPDDPDDTFNNSEQFCGSYFDQDENKMPYILSNNQSSNTIKGFTCPINSKCVVGANPYEGTISFDNLIQSFELVYVIISMNTFTDILYNVVDSESEAASIFFILAILVLSVWLLSILIAVIVTSFKITKELDEKELDKNEENEIKGHNSAMVPNGENFDLLNSLKTFNKFKIIFLLVILVNFIVSCTNNIDISDYHKNVINYSEIATTAVLDLEIIIRILIYITKFRFKDFFKSKTNNFDLLIAVTTTIIIIPPMKKLLGQLYNWSTVFQIARFYRLVLHIKFLRVLWFKIIGKFNTIAHLIYFYLFLLVVVSLFCSRLFEGTISSELEEQEDINFSMRTFLDNFVGLFVVTSTEGWTEILYNLQMYAKNKVAAGFNSMTIIFWFIISNSFIINIFIAVIAENLEVSKTEKKEQQIRHFIMSINNTLLDKNNQQTSFFSHLKDKFKILSKHFPNIYKILFENPFLEQRRTDIENTIDPDKLAKNMDMENKIMRARKQRFLKNNPNFNMTLFIFLTKSPLRRFFQLFVRPIGERYDENQMENGRKPNEILHALFVLVMDLSTIGLLITACYVTPLYSKDQLDGSKYNWSFFLDIYFIAIFSFEFFVKVIADGFYLTPNGIMQSPWNVIDFYVLISLWINFICSLIGNTGLATIFRGFKALRTLGLLRISNTAKETFHKTILSGFHKILGAGLVSMSLLIPFSLWGLNIFSGRLGRCNDDSLSLSECFNEFMTSPYNWEYLAPRVFSNPPLQFDTFWYSFSTLFQIISLEGWVDLLIDVMNSTGIGSPPKRFAQPMNALFPIIFIFVAIIFILNLFVSIIINNYSQTNGTAYLIEEQRSWYEVKKLLNQVQPSSRPITDNFSSFRCFCYELVVDRKSTRHRYWNLIYDMVLFFHAIILVMETYPSNEKLDNLRLAMFMGTTFFFFIHIALVIYSKGFKKSNKWDFLSIIISVPVFFLCVALFFLNKESVALDRITKTLLLLVILFVIPRSEKLSELLKFASASAFSLLSLFYIWVILFLVYAIALNQIFGLTRIGENGSGTQNFRTIPKALVLLFKMSFGEGWNYSMQDYYVQSPYCTESTTLYGSDCGSKLYANLFFISWNILSMFIMLNLFISLIVDNFSYVYQESGKLQSITRSEIRKFKDAWAKFDKNATGFIDKDDIYKFLSCLDGVLSFQVYENDFKIPQLKKLWISQNPRWTPYQFDLNLAAMKRSLNAIDVEEIQTRKIIFERIIEEALIYMEENNHEGISFKKLLEQIALNSLFKASRCLILDDYLDRKLLLRKVDARIKKKR